MKDQKPKLNFNFENKDRRAPAHNKLKFKQHFKSLNYYSMPTSILYTFRKRVHFLGYFAFTLWAIVFTIL